MSRSFIKNKIVGYTKKETEKRDKTLNENFVQLNEIIKSFFQYKFELFTDFLAK